MFNWDFILGLGTGAATVSLAVWLYKQSTGSSESGQITESVTATVDPQITDAVTGVFSTSDATLTIAPTLVSVPRRGRKPSVKTPAVKTPRTTTNTAKKKTAKGSTRRR
jgi:hypothetical protein